MSSVIGITVGTPFNIDPLSERVSRNDKRITNLEQGIIPDPFMTDDSVAYIKEVPANALPYAEVSKVGGMTYYADDVGMLFEAGVTEIESIGANLFDKSKVQNAIETDTGFSFINKEANGTPFVIGRLKDIAPNLKVGDNIIFHLTPINTIHIYGFLYLNGSGTGWYSNTFHTITEGDLNGSVFAYGKQNVVCEYKDLIFTKVQNTPYSPYRYSNIAIPAAVQAVDGYGWGVNESIYNYIDFNKKQFVKRVECVDMGTLAWVGFSSESKISHTDKIYKPGAHILTAVSQLNGINKIYIDTVGALVVLFSEGAFTSRDEVKASLSGVMLYYELETPEITDISNILPADNFIEVGAGGTITAKQKWGYSYDVPSEITYMLKGE